MKTLILGIGNPILCDDAIGLRVIDELEGLFLFPGITLHKTSLAGINLLDILIDFDRAIIVDAIQTGGIPGEVYCLTPEQLTSRQNVSLPHLNIDFSQILILGKRLNQIMPAEVVMVAIEADDIFNFGEGLTPRVEQSIPSAVEQVLSILKRWDEEDEGIRKEAEQKKIKADSGYPTKQDHTLSNI